MGTGAFHAGVEIFGREWSFGYCDQDRTGVFCYAPGKCSAHAYREPVSMGDIRLTEDAVTKVVEQLSAEWLGTSYDLLSRNCCHFSSALCEALGVGPAPEWVTNLAGTSAGLLKAVVTVKERHDQLVFAAADIAKGKMEELNEQYSLIERIESFSNQEIPIDEGIVQSKVMSWWNSAMDSVEQVIDAAQRPVDLTSVVEPVESKATQYWTTAVQQVAGLWSISHSPPHDGSTAIMATPDEADHSLSEEIPLVGIRSQSLRLGCSARRHEAQGDSMAAAQGNVSTADAGTEIRRPVASEEACPFEDFEPESKVVTL
jgi:hypothetical protein